MVHKIDAPIYTLHTWFSMTRLINDFLRVCVCTLMHCAIGKHLCRLSDELNLQQLGRKQETNKLLVSSQGQASTTLWFAPIFSHWKAPWHPNFINLLGNFMMFLQKKKLRGQKIFLVLMASNNVSNHTRKFCLFELLVRNNLGQISQPQQSNVQ